MGAESKKKAHLTVDLREPSFNVSTSWRRLPESTPKAALTSAEGTFFLKWLSALYRCLETEYFVTPENNGQFGYPWDRGIAQTINTFRFS